MRIIPEINIMNGYCVKHGTHYPHCSEIISHSPRKIAKMLVAQGATCLQLKDIDGIQTGHIVNEETVKKVIDSVDVPIEVYGGICSIKDIETILNLGTQKVILQLSEEGTFGLLKDAIGYFGTKKISVSLQLKNNALFSHGSRELSTAETVTLLRKIIELGIYQLQIENSPKFGFEFLDTADDINQVIDARNLKVTLSGGIQTMKELELVKNKNMDGVILGDVLYEKRIDLSNAIEWFGTKS